MWFCLACFLRSGWSGIPAHRCCWREQTTATCGCGRSRPGNAKPSRALRPKQPRAKSCLMVRGGGGGGERTQMLQHSHIKISQTKLSSSGKRAVVGYEDGTVRVWDLKQGNAIHVFKGKSGGVLMLSGLAKIFRDFVHEMNHGKDWRRILCCFVSGQDGHQGALTCLACNKDGTLVLTGSVDGYAKLINTATGKVGVTASAAGARGENTLHPPVSCLCP